jgi:predicted nucleic acid-binding protein
MIVSDAGPIIIFARIGQLSLLRGVTGSLLIPHSVYDEIVFKKAVCRARPMWLKPLGFRKCLSQTVSIVEGLPSVLHEESAKRSRLQESKGLNYCSMKFVPCPAIQLGIDVMGTLRILANAKQLSHVNLVPRHRPDAVRRLSVRPELDSTVSRDDR